MIVVFVVVFVVIVVNVVMSDKKFVVSKKVKVKFKGKIVVNCKVSVKVVVVSSDEVVFIKVCKVVIVKGKCCVIMVECGVCLVCVFFVLVFLMFGEVMGLCLMFDVLVLCFFVVLVMDQNNGEVLFQKNLLVVLLIVLIIKLMMVLVVIDVYQLMDELFEIMDEDCDYECNIGLCLCFGMMFMCEDLLLLVLMLLENCVVLVLGCNYLGGCFVFVVVMNCKVYELGMNDMYYVDLNGLLSSNVLSVQDFVKIVMVVYKVLFIC